MVVVGAHRAAPLAGVAVTLLACGTREPAVDIGGPMGSDPPPECGDRSADAPAPRSEVGMVIDTARNRLVVHGGNTAAAERCDVPPSVIVDELWAFHLDCKSWERLDASGGPGPLARQATVHDTARERMLVFGGRRSDSVTSSELWALDLSEDRWQLLPTTGAAPPALAEAVAELDRARDALVVFGGDPGGFVGTRGLYVLDLDTLVWREISATGAPSARLYHASALVDDTLVVFGGTAGFNPPYLDDVHTFDLASETWSSLSPNSATPGPRFGAELVATAGAGILMAFGHDATDLGNRNDVWELDLGSGGWSRVHAGDAFNNPPTGPCEFPADFTTIEAESPERRYSVGAASTDTEAFFFGGKADCGYLNDVWRLDLTSGAWTLERASTGGEGCLRTGRVDCVSMCF